MPNGRWPRWSGPMPRIDPLWNDWRPAAYVPDHSTIFFGPDPCHTFAREQVDPLHCPACGGAYEAPNGRTLTVASQVGQADPIRDYEAHVSDHASARKGKLARSAFRADPLTVVCALCLRSAHDGSAALERAVKPALEDPDLAAPADDDPKAEDGYPLASSPGGTVKYDPRLEFRDHLRGGLGGHRKGAGRKKKRPRAKAGRR